MFMAMDDITLMPVRINDQKKLQSAHLMSKMGAALERLPVVRDILIVKLFHLQHNMIHLRNIRLDPNRNLGKKRLIN